MTCRKISIVICTANRADMLKRCLASANQMSILSRDAVELIVVDNNSTDHTKLVYEEFYSEANFPTKYVFEPRRGKSHALNSGISMATGDVVYFTDDDCVFSQDLLTTLSEELAANPDVDGWGGKVELLDPSDLPISIRLLERRVEFNSIRQLFELIPGCNMAFRRRVFDAIGGFDTRLGPGTPRVVEDADFLYRALKAGFRLVYSPRMLIYHGHGRKDPGDLAKTRRGYMIGRGAFYAKHLLRLDREVLRVAYWEGMNLLRPAIQDFVRLNFSGENLLNFAMLVQGGLSYLGAALRGKSSIRSVGPAGKFRA